jgi:hypothetical protein
VHVKLLHISLSSESIPLRSITPLAYVIALFILCYKLNESVASLISLKLIRIAVDAKALNFPNIFVNSSTFFNANIPNSS